MSLIWFCAAGYSFFPGIALLVLTVVFSAFCKKIYQRVIIYPLAAVAVFFIYLSATPLPSWFYVVWTISILVWLFCVALRVSPTQKFSISIYIAVICLSIIALLTELPHHLMPSLAKEKFEKLYIIGDSLSAGVGGKNEKTWPEIFHDEYGINIIDLSEPGATVASAVGQANQVKSEKALVLLEIGGNDLFASTQSFQFEQNLRQILNAVSSPKHTIVMLELPLQPKHIEYGRIQRRLAKQFNVILIPRRFLVSVLSAKGATAGDLIHLEPLGQELMAEKLFSLIGPQLEPIATDEKN